MKLFFIIFTILFSTNTLAEIYKCTKNSRISYQQIPCKKTGSVGKKFETRVDISKQQQSDAKARMDSDLAAYHEAKKLKKEANDKERVIRAEENKANAAHKSAAQAKRQANAFEEGNKIARKGRSIYAQRALYPYRNIKKFSPLGPEKK